MTETKYPPFNRIQTREEALEKLRNGSERETLGFFEYPTFKQEIFLIRQGKLAAYMYTLPEEEAERIRFKKENTLYDPNTFKPNPENENGYDWAMAIGHEGSDGLHFMKCFNKNNEPIITRESFPLNPTEIRPITENSFYMGPDLLVHGPHDKVLFRFAKGYSAGPGGMQKRDKLIATFKEAYKKYTEQKTN